MKAYVISEKPNLGIAMANAISANGIAAIISEIEPGDYREMLQDAVDNVGNYDFTTMLSSQAFEATMRANRNSRLRAVVCRNSSDAAKARKANANLIIIDSNSFTKEMGSSIVRGWTSATAKAVEEGAEEIEDEERKGVGIMEMGKQMVGSISKTRVTLPRVSIKKNAKPKEEEADEEKEEGDSKPKSGIVGRLKYTFGLED